MGCTTPYLWWSSTIPPFAGIRIWVCTRWSRLGRHHRLELFKVDCSALLAFALSLALILYMGEATGKSIPRIDIPSLGLCFATSQAVVIGVVHRRRRRGTYLLIWHSSAILAL